MGSGSGQPVLGGIHAVVCEAIHRRHGHVQSGISRGIINQHAPVGILDPSISEGHVHHVAHILLALGHQQVAAGLGDDARGVVECRHVHIEHVAQSAGRSPHAVGQVQPSVVGLDGVLALRLQVGQSFPGLQVPCARYGRRGRGCREVAWATVIVALGTEHAVDPAVLVLRQSHVVDVRGGLLRVGHGDGLLPEAEVIDAVRTLGNGEEALAVGPLHAAHQQVAPIQADGSGVQHRVHHDALHQVGVVLLTEIISPLQRCVVSRQHRVAVLFVDAVACMAEQPLGRAASWQRLVLACQQLFVPLVQFCNSFLETFHFCSRY